MLLNVTFMNYYLVPYVVASSAHLHIAVVIVLLQPQDWSEDLSNLKKPSAYYV
jgi:hypothetical protein